VLLTRIICTLGPASLNPKALRRLTDLGVDLLRINLSHSPLAELEQTIELIRAHSSVPICLDTQGAQVRTGPFADGRITLAAGERVTLVPMPAVGTRDCVPLHPASVAGELRVGDTLTVDFDGVVLQVVSEGENCQARVLCGGVVGSNKAVTVDCAVTLHALTEVDVEALTIGRRCGLRHVALSFTNRAADVAQARALAGPDAEIISKVETRMALDHLDEILSAADAILIDRGDLSREVPLERIPLVQKDIIARANRAGVPVNVATNLLETMITGTRPTRAEVNDVVNTLLDGADGLVLAAETAIGRNPVGCVSVIRSLIDEVSWLRTRDSQPAWAAIEPSAVAGLVPAHGGHLVVADVAPEPERLRATVVDPRVMLDARQLAVGGFSPLSGFMDRAMLAAVLATHRLPDGTVWPMPILLPWTDGWRPSHGDRVRLESPDGDAAVVTVSDVFEWDVRQLAHAWFGTDNAQHPGVAAVLAWPGVFVAGPVALTARTERRRYPSEMTPTQARAVFAHRQWQRVVGFHTRNVPHRVHEWLQLQALAAHHCDGVFVHPVIGPKKAGDCSGAIIIEAYEHVARVHYPANAAVVAGWATYSRYAGPREALFTALVRQNYGCSHFIVGRDHTGVGAFYGADQSRRFIESFAPELGIRLILSPEVVYCGVCEAYVDTCEHGEDAIRRISGTQARDALRAGQALPDWFMRDDVSQLILAALARGEEVFVA
jgi:pyruvate kinase